MAAITVQGTIKDNNGTLPTSGTVTFTQDDFFIDTGNIIVPAKSETANVSAVDGSFSVVLGSTTDAIPGTRVYNVVFSGVIGGETVSESLGSIEIGPDPATQQLKDLIIAGLSDSSAVTPTISGAAPALVLYETDQVLPLGRWRIILSGDVLSLEKNTHASGDFSTKSTWWTVTAAGAVTCAGGSVTSGVAGTTQGSFKVTGATSGTVTITGAAAAGTWTFTLPTGGGTADFALITNGSGVSSWVTGQSIAGLKTASTPQFARLGLGAAADTTALARLSVNAAALPSIISNTIAQLGGADGQSNELWMEAFAGQAVIGARRANNTAASPQALSNGAAILALSARGYGATGYSTSRAAIAMIADQDWTDANQGTRLIFRATPQNSTTQADQWYMYGSGAFEPGGDNTKRIGSSSSRASEIHVGGFVAIGTNPATTGDLRLDYGADAINIRNSANNSNLSALAGLTHAQGGANTLQIGADASWVTIMYGTESPADINAPSANNWVMYARDNGGKTELVVRFATGAIQRLAIEP